MDEQHHQLLKHLDRSVAFFVIVDRAYQQGHDITADLAVMRQYLTMHLPAYLAFMEHVYGGESIPPGLAGLADLEAMRL